MLRAEAIGRSALKAAEGCVLAGWFPVRHAEGAVEGEEARSREEDHQAAGYEGEVQLRAGALAFLAGSSSASVPEPGDPLYGTAQGDTVTENRRSTGATAGPLPPT